MSRCTGSRGWPAYLSTGTIEVRVDGGDSGIAEAAVDRPGIEACVAQFALHGLPEFPRPGVGVLDHALARELVASVQRLHHEIGRLFRVSAFNAAAALQHPGEVVHGHGVPEARCPSVQGDGSCLVLLYALAL